MSGTSEGRDHGRGEANSRQVGGTHYASDIQHWDLVIANDIPYLEAMVIRYVMRWRKKDGMKDLEKARHFLDKLIEVETAKIEALKGVKNEP